MHNEEKRLQNFSDADEGRVAGLLGSLERVGTPGDFDVRVRARIAQGRQSEPRNSWMPMFARVGAPVVLLTAIGGYFGYNALYQPGNVEMPSVAVAEAPAVAPAKPKPPIENIVEPVAVPTAEVATVKPPANRNVNRPISRPKRGGSIDLPMDETGGGSFDAALSEANTLTPGNANIATAGNSVPTLPAVTRSVREVFGSMGLRASHSGAGWRVSSVSGRAAAAGLKAGDIIESVNGRPVGVNTVFDKDFTGRVLRVKRDGASVQITLN